MAQKERELIGERIRAALAAAKARGRVLGGDRGYRPAQPPDGAAAAEARQLAAERASHRLVLEVNRLRAEGVVGQAALARALNERGVPVPSGRGAWTHTRLRPAVSRRRGELRFVPGWWPPDAGEELSPLAPRCVLLDLVGEAAANAVWSASLQHGLG